MKSMKKIIIIVAVSSCVLILAFIFAGKYSSCSFKRNLISEAIHVPLIFQKDTTDVDISQLKGQFIVLYFGDSTGKNRLKSHEKFMKICSRMENDDRVKLFAVHCNPDNGPVETENLQANGSHVQTLSLGSNILLEQLKINDIPTVLIISPEWEIKFRGSPDAAYTCLLGLTYEI
jgi:cytochrome oxidase Cu insertion factor (SCO1/SenC/PrrC family)